MGQLTRERANFEKVEYVLCDKIYSSNLRARTANKSYLFSLGSKNECPACPPRRAPPRRVPSVVCSGLRFDRFSMRTAAGVLEDDLLSAGSLPAAESLDPLVKVP